MYQVVGTCGTDDEVSEKEIAELAEEIPTADVQLFYQVAIMGRRDLHLAPDPRSGAEMTMLRMLAFKPAAAETGGSIAGGAATASAAPKTKASAAEVVQAQSAATRVESKTWSDPDWNQLVSDLRLSGAVRLLASNCAYLRRESNTVYLGLDPRSESMLTKQRTDTIAEFLSRHFGEKLVVDITMASVAEETPIQQETRMADERLEEARQTLEADPNVQKLKSMFGAELKTDTIEIISGDKG